MGLFCGFLFHPMRITKFNCILSILYIGLLSSCTPNQSENKNGNGNIDSLNSSDVFFQLNKQILREPDNATAYYQRAKIYLEKDNINQAYADASKAVALDSSKMEFLLLLADVSFRGLQVRKSVEVYEKCLRLDPKNLEANLKLAEIYLYIKGYPKSIMYANEAMKIDRKLTKPYFLKGFVYKESGDTAKALSSFETVVDLEPENYDAHIQLGNLYAAMNNKLALQYYGNAISLRPRSTEALYNRGLFLQNIGELNKATGDYNVILKLDPKYADAHYNIGYIALVYKKDYPKAIEQFSEAIRLNKDYVEAYYNRGLAHEFKGEIKEALEDYHKALGIFPTYKLASARIELLSASQKK